MEVLCRSGGIDDPDVDLGRQCQETLDARAGMIGALSLISMWEQQHQGGRQSPFGAAREQELIDDRLRVINKVAILGFPDDQALRRNDVLAHLEADRAGLTQWAVQDFKGSQRLRNFL